MRILFSGTPEIAVPSLEVLARDHQVVGVLTNPDRVTGRGKKIIPSPVKAKALELGLNILQPEKLDETFIEDVKALEPELLVVFAFGKIFRQKFLDVFPKGGINIHPSLLPKYRGPSPITATILNGDGTWGLSIQKLARKMDSGDILFSKEYPVQGGETTESLSDLAAREGAQALAAVTADFDNLFEKAEPQDHEKATFCHLIKKDDGKIEWSADASVIERQTRAYYPWPNAFTTFKDKWLKIIEADVCDLESMNPDVISAINIEENDTKTPGRVLGIDKKQGFLIQTGNGILGVKKLQLQAKKALDFKAFNNGTKDFTGSVLGENE